MGGLVAIACSVMVASSSVSSATVSTSRANCERKLKSVEWDRDFWRAEVSEQYNNAVIWKRRAKSEKTLRHRCESDLRVRTATVAELVEADPIPVPDLNLLDFDWLDLGIGVGLGTLLGILLTR